MHTLAIYTPHLHLSRPYIYDLEICFILVQLNKCVVLFCKGGIMVMGVCLGQFCLNMNVGWHIVCSEWG